MIILVWMTLLLTATDISSSSDPGAKPTLRIPPLTEGQEATLTCNAPDSCPDPKFNWTWVLPGENNSYTAGKKNNSYTAGNKNNSYTAGNKTQFNPSAKHHGAAVTCRVTCSNHMSAEVTVTLNVTYVKAPKISGETRLKAGDALSLTCTADSFPQSVIKWSKYGLNKTLNNQTKSESGSSALIIPNVTVEDSGLYFCAAGNMTQNITVTVMNQSLEITGEKEVTEGHSLNLTCSFDMSPTPFITWTKLDINKTMSNDTGAATLFISNITAEQSGRYICTAKHLNHTLTGEVVVKIKYVRKHQITGNTAVKEGGTLNLTCTVHNFHPSVIIWTKHGSNRTLLNKTGPDFKKSNLVLHNVTVEDSGQYFCTANNLTDSINISVIYQRSLEITGESSVTEGGALKLTCSVDSWPPSFITWVKHGSNTTLKNDTGAASLIIHNVTAEHSGPYICTAKHLDNALMKEVNITVRMRPEILTESGCEAQLDTLTCVCISQGIPSPTIKWLLENQTEYSFNTTVSKHSVKSTLILTAADHRWGPSVCVSSNENGETKRNLTIKQADKKEDQITKMLRSVTQPGTVIPFLTGMLLSALIFCLLMLCYRKKQKAERSETLEMVMSQESSLTNGGQVMEYEQIQAEGTAGGAEAGSSDVEYSDVKLLMWKKKISKEKKKETTDTDYAKIKPKKAKPQANDEEKEKEELKLCPQEVAGGEDAAVYSNVTELMDQS